MPLGCFWVCPPHTNQLPHHAEQAVYGVLKEAEHRSTFYIPYWNLPLTKYLGGCWVGGGMVGGELAAPTQEHIIDA